MAQENNIHSNSTTNIYDKFIALLHHLYSDARKRTTLLIICVIGVPAVFAFLNSIKSDTYTSSFTVVYEELVRKVYGDRLDKLDILLKNDESKAQQLLDLDNKTISGLVGISSTNILGEELSKDMNTDRIPFIVHFTVKDTSHILKIQDAIIHYLETGNRYLAEKRTLRTTEIEKELIFLEKQLDMMDTFKRNHYSTSASSEKTSIDEGSIYQLSYDLYKKKQELVKKLDMPRNLYVIDDAIVTSSNKRSYILIIGIGIFTGLLLYMFIVYLMLPVLHYNKN